MKTVIDISTLPEPGQIFSCPQGPSALFSIIDNGVTYTVNCFGYVISPEGCQIQYNKQNPITCLSCGHSGVVSDFLTLSL